MHPPQLLVPFEFVARMAETVHEVEDAVVLLVPTVLHFLKGDFHSLLDEFGAAKTLAEVHDEPHGFDGVTGVHLAAVEAIDEVAVLAQSLNNQAELGTVEDVHDFVQAVVDGFLQEGGLQQGLYLEGYVAEDHRQVEGLQGTGTGSGLRPTSLGVVGLGEHDVEGALGNVCVFGRKGICSDGIAAHIHRREATLGGCLQGDGELTEGDDSEGVGEDVVGFHEGVAFAVEGEVPVEVAVVAVLLQELSTLNGGVEPLLAGLHGVVELGEHPHLAALHPHEFVGVIDVADAVEAGEIAAELGVLAFVEPEGNGAVKQF